MEHDHPFDLLANEAILPAQYYSASRALEPEQLLALAVLQDAISIAQKGYPPESRKAARAAYLEALNWLYGESAGMFSFDCVCDILGIEASALRTRLKTWDGKLTNRSPVRSGHMKPTVGNERAVYNNKRYRSASRERR